MHLSGCDRAEPEDQRTRSTTERTIRCPAERRRTTGHPPSRSASQMSLRTTVQRRGREKAGLGTLNVPRACSNAVPLRHIADIWPRRGVRRDRSGDAASPKERSGYVLQDGLGNADGYADCEGTWRRNGPRGTSFACGWHGPKAPLPDAQFGKALSEMLLSRHHAA